MQWRDDSDSLNNHASVKERVTRNSVDKSDTATACRVKTTNMGNTMIEIV